LMSFQRRMTREFLPMSAIMLKGYVNESLQLAIPRRTDDRRLPRFAKTR
jgi:hypothetical protein